MGGISDVRVGSRVIHVVTPAPPGSRKGNRVTAVRWERLLGQLGHRVRVLEELDETPCDLLIALHARKSYPSILRSRQTFPERPIVVTMTGTDLYGDILTDRDAQHSLELATRLVVLQRKGVDALPAHVRDKARVIYQSVVPPSPLPTPEQGTFDVCVLGHLREVKDPFRTAEAARLLPSTSRIRVLHLGGALSDDMVRRAEREVAENPRYRWLGELSWEESMETLARCRLLVQSSRLEGGANAVGEALACGVPVVASRIDGSVGILGEDYPGYYTFGDTEELAGLLQRAEDESSFYDDLRARCESLRELVSPENERESWRRLLEEVL